MAVDFGGLARKTCMGPSLGVLCDAVPYELLLEEGSCGAGGGMGEAVDEVEDSSSERKSDPWARAAGTNVAEDGGAMIVDGDVLPLKGGERRPTGGRLGVLGLQAGEVGVVEAKTDQ